MPIVQCSICGSDYRIIPSRLGSSRFCSYACAGKWRRDNYSGEGNPRWKSGERVKNCGGCGAEMRWPQGLPFITWQARKFCSPECVRRHQKRYTGSEHPNFKPDSRRKAARGKHGAWARAVISRDHATCQRCGATGVELHAHHIKSFAEFPELRWEPSNGVTLCHSCHWAIHSASNANAVNSGNTLTGDAEGNPEPSFGRKPIEGVTTRGRAYRRWFGHCEWCNVFISKRWSDTAGKRHQFCSKRCSGKFMAANRTYRRWKNPEAHGSNASTSAAPERDEIV